MDFLRVKGRGNGQATGFGFEETGMRYELRSGAYTFSYYDRATKKNVRLRQSDHPRITAESDAKRFTENWDAKIDALHQRIKKREEWRQKFHDFERLEKIFELSRREDAPGSWEMNCMSLRHYVLPFFLDVKEENNVNMWAFFFEDYRSWLETVEPLHNLSEPSISYSTKNIAIRSLNAFLKVLKRRGILETLETCRLFSARKLYRRGFEVVMNEDEQDKICSAIREISDLGADAFYVALHTGMRIGELMGISLADFYQGSARTESMESQLAKYEMMPYGFLVIESQLGDQQNVRDDFKRVRRKGLKGKAESLSDDCRIIPIVDREAYRILVERWNTQQGFFQWRRFTERPKDYLLFDGLTRNNYPKMLVKAQSDLKLRHRFTSHDCRHTYSTWLAEKTNGDLNLCRLILGHSKEEMTKRYVHLSAKIARDVKIADQLNRKMEVVA